VASYWFPADRHPDGPSDTAWFRVVDGWGYQTDGNPRGRSTNPCFRVIDGWARPTLSLPRDDAPTFQIIGTLVYADSGVVWFRIVEERSS
jgi:hypothetical protein